MQAPPNTILAYMEIEFINQHRRFNEIHPKIEPDV